jgi:hypothetical protein
MINLMKYEWINERRSKKIESKNERNCGRAHKAIAIIERAPLILMY